MTANEGSGPAARHQKQPRMYLTVREALDAVMSVHTSTSPKGELEIRERVDLADLSPDSRSRYQAAWRILWEARQRSLF